jgi:hypothetical protein
MIWRFGFTSGLDAIYAAKAFKMLNTAANTTSPFTYSVDTHSWMINLSVYGTFEASWPIVLPPYHKVMLFTSSNRAKCPRTYSCAFASRIFLKLHLTQRTFCSLLEKQDIVYTMILLLCLISLFKMSLSRNNVLSASRNEKLWKFHDFVPSLLLKRFKYVDLKNRISMLRITLRRFLYNITRDLICLFPASETRHYYITWPCSFHSFNASERSWVQKGTTEYRYSSVFFLLFQKCWSCEMCCFCFPKGYRRPLHYSGFPVLMGHKALQQPWLLLYCYPLRWCLENRFNFNDMLLLSSFLKKILSSRYDCASYGEFNKRNRTRDRDSCFVSSDSLQKHAEPSM